MGVIHNKSTDFWLNERHLRGLTGHVTLAVPLEAENSTPAESQAVLAISLNELEPLPGIGYQSSTCSLRRLPRALG